MYIVKLKLLAFFPTLRTQPMTILLLSFATQNTSTQLGEHVTYKPVKKLASDVGYFRTRSKFLLVELCCGPISLSMKVCHSPRWRTVSTLMYITQSHLKIFYFLKSKLLYMGKFHHVEAKAIKREQLKHHQILYILRNIFVY